ncbi:MAG: hypothetical protein ACR2GY_02560 [Phycisphaerales bacterium]
MGACMMQNRHGVFTKDRATQYLWGGRYIDDIVVHRTLGATRRDDDLADRNATNEERIENAYFDALDSFTMNASASALRKSLSLMTLPARYRHEDSTWWMYYFLDERFLKSGDRRYRSRAFRWLRHSAEAGERLGLYSLAGR